MIGGLLIALATIGHFALHVVIYNRLNATGLPRSTIKVIKYLFFATCLIIPLVFGWRHASQLTQLQWNDLVWQSLAWWEIVYGVCMLATLVYYGPDWVSARPMFNRDAILVESSVDRHCVKSSVENKLARTRKCELLSSLPGNQIFELAVEQKTLRIHGLPMKLDGFKVAHFSDVHLTGHVAPDFYRFAIQRAMLWEPDIFALTGDVVDKERCIPWLEDCFSNATAKFGKYFVLGNHDLRVPDPGDVRDKMVELGWCDLGGQELVQEIHGAAARLIGNEAPWFPAPVLPELSASRDEQELRLLLSHSPDQFEWARQHGVQLMLAGHTHGGQGRLPWIGPVLSPSKYGSRYASGCFRIAETTMHVSRGLSGVHLMRINCPPEIALITLRAEV